MAINRGAVASQIFNLPQYNPVQYGGGGSTGGRASSGPTMDDEYFGIPKAPTELDYTGEIDNRSREVMQRWADLRNFAYSMKSMYGIDVTRPDPSRPESIAANQAFQQELGNIQYDIDALKTSREDWVRRASLAEQNQFTLNDTAGQVLQSQMTPSQAGQTQMVNPTVKFAADQFGRGFRLPSEVAAGDQAASALSGMYGAQGDQMSSLQAGMINPYLEPFAPRSDDGGMTTKPTFEYLKRLSAVAKGASDYKISEVYNDPETGQPLSSTKEFNDAFEGIDSKTGRQTTGIIQEILRNPSTGSMYLKLSTQDDLVPVSASELMYGISKANPKYPTVDKLTTFLGKFGGTDDVGELQPDAFLDRGAIAKSQSNTERLSREAERVAQADRELQDIIGSSPKGGGFYRFFKKDQVTPPLSKLDGITIEFQRDNENNILIDGTSEDNIDDKLKALGYTAIERRKEKDLLKTTEGFLKFLKKFGAKTDITSPEIDPDI